MSELVNAIRDRLVDRTIDAGDLDHFIEVARQGGVSATEMRQILDAIDSTPHGLTPELRARMLVRLERHRANEAIALVTARPQRFNEVQRLTELRARVAVLVEDAKRAKQALQWGEYNLERSFEPAGLDEGRFDRRQGIGPRAGQKAIDELRELQRNALQATEALRADLSRLSVDERQIAFASMSNRWDWGSLSEAAKPRVLIGMSDADRARLAAPYPADGMSHDGQGTARFAGMAFEGPVNWTFSDGNTLQLPEGTRIRSLPVGGDFQVEGKNIRLPDGQILEEGRLRIRDGVVTVSSGSTVRVGGVPMRSRQDDARVRGANGTIAAGPGMDFALPVLDAQGRSTTPPPAPAAPAVGPDGQPVVQPAAPTPPTPQPRDLSRRNVRYTAQEVTLPEGTELRRGTGSMTVLFEGERAVGMLDGSSQRDAGVQTYRRIPNGQSELVVSDPAGERGKLTSGAAVYRDATLIGFMPGARGTIDGVGLEVEGYSGSEMTSYRRAAQDHFELGKGAVVTSVPQGTQRLTGEAFKVRLGGVEVEVVSGGVLVENGVVTQVLPGSRVRTPVGTITTQANAAPVRLLGERPATAPQGNAVFMDQTNLIAAGRGFTVEAGTGPGILASGQDQIYTARGVRNAVVLNGGSVRLRPHSGDHMKPPGVEAYDIVGDVTLQTGPQSFNSVTRRGTADRPGVGGPLMWAQLGGERYEIDARPMWSSADPETDTGRTILMRRIQSERFGGALTRSVESILDGRVRLSVEQPNVQPALTRSIQETLSYYLDRRVELTGRFDAQTADAVKVFQRFMLLEQTGVVDAQTMRMLDEIAPAANQPMITRTAGRFGPPVEGQVASLISGATPALAYRGRGAPTSSGELIGRVQQTLNERGFPAGTDSLFGPGMQGALRSFQTANGLPATGEIDAATMRKLVELSPSTSFQQVRPRPKYMVMVYVNDSVPDELRRFRELAELRGATPVIIGPPDAELRNPQDIARFFARAERGEIDLDWIVPSGHSTGSSTWGPYGRFEYSDLQRWSRHFPRAFAQVEKLSLLNCYNVTPEKARDYWPALFPNVHAVVGFMYAAPGKETQASDEFLLNSGVMLAQIQKGDSVPRPLAQDIGRRFERDEVIMFQNAGIWLRTPDNREGYYGLTSTARREMQKKGAMETLRTIPAELQQAYQNFSRAETEQFQEPPSGMTSQLRDYLGAVQHALDSWEGRIARLRRFNEQRDRQLAPHRARREQDSTYVIPDIPVPEEFQNSYSWESSFTEMQTLRARILSLIKSHNIRDQFGAFYGRNIDAFNAWMTQQGREAGKQVVLFPRPSELSAMNRRQVAERLRQVQESLGQFDYARRGERIQREEWSMMRGRNPAERTMASPDRFLERARQFLVDLNPELIQPEWLDDGLLAADLRRNVHTVVTEEPAPQRSMYGSND